MGTNVKDAALLAAQRDFDCCTEPPALDLQRNEKLCTTCNLVHAGECF